jgi:hypothetical protein
VLVTNVTSWADPVRQENPQQTKGPPTSGEYINNFDSVKYNRIISQVFSVRWTCEFQQPLWKLGAHGSGKFAGILACIILFETPSARISAGSAAFLLG